MPILAETVTHLATELYAVIGALSGVCVYLERRRVTQETRHRKELLDFAAKVAAKVDRDSTPDVPEGD